jgi:hypothetical protein
MSMPAGAVKATGVRGLTRACLSLAAVSATAGCGDGAPTLARSTSDSSTTHETVASERLSAAEWIEAVDAVCAQANESVEGQPSNVDELSLFELQTAGETYRERMRGLEALTPAPDLVENVDTWLEIERERTALIVAMAEAGSAEAAADLMDGQVESGVMEDLNDRGLDASIAIAQAAGADWYGC